MRTQAPARRELLDETASFLSLYREVEALGRRKKRASMPPAAYEFEYLLVPGLLTRWNGGYLTPNRDRLTSLGLEARIVGTTHTMDSVARNAAAMARELESCRRPAIVLGHSKGALDTWAALAQRPELAEKVRAFVAIQAPISGARVADWYRSRAAARAVVRLGAWITGGSEQAVWDLTTAARAAFLKEHPFPVDKIPAYSVVTTIDRRVHRFVLGRWVLSRHGEPNDGMVSTPLGIIPGSGVISLRDMDHLDPVTTTDGIESFFCSTTYEAATLTEALVRLIFS